MKFTARIGVTLSILLAAVAMVGPWLVGDPTVASGSDFLASPSGSHLLGTDPFGRDVLARTVHGARVSLIVALVSTVVALMVGVALGVLAGGHHKPVARALSHFINFALAVPRVILLLVLVAATGRLGPWALALMLGLTGWPTIARLARGEALRLEHSGFVTASEALGASLPRRLLREILPGALPAGLVAATLGIADALLLEAGLSYLGIGIRPPHPSWGGMILEAQPYLAQAPWLLFGPAVALVMATVAATLLGEALRARLNPVQR